MASPAVRALRVGVLLGDNLVEERVFRGATPITFGQSLRCTLSIPGDGVPLEHVLFVRDQGRLLLRVTAKMDSETPVLLIEKEPVKLEDLEVKMKRIIDKTGRRQMLLDIDGNVPWGFQTAILDAAKGNGVHKILYHPRPRR